MNCACHGEPAYWQKDARLPRGGWWECRVKRAAHNATRQTNPERRERICQQRRDRYDNDPIFRLGENLKGDARKRAKHVQRMKEELHGSLQDQGRSRPSVERASAPHHA